MIHIDAIFCIITYKLLRTFNFTNEVVTLEGFAYGMLTEKRDYMLFHVLCIYI